MRALKYIAILLAILLVLSLLFVGYFFLTASVSIVAYKAQGIQATEVPEQFEKIRASVENTTFRGTYFNTTPLEDAESYVRFRLERAGLKFESLFEQGAMEAVTRRLRVPGARPKAGGPESVSLLYPLALGNALAAAFNLAADLGLGRVGPDVINRI